MPRQRSTRNPIPILLEPTEEELRELEQRRWDEMQGYFREFLLLGSQDFISIGENNSVVIPINDLTPEMADLAFANFPDIRAGIRRLRDFDRDNGAIYIAPNVIILIGDGGNFFESYPIRPGNIRGIIGTLIENNVPIFTELEGISIYSTEAIENMDELELAENTNQRMTISEYLHDIGVDRDIEYIEIPLNNFTWENFETLTSEMENFEQPPGLVLNYYESFRDFMRSILPLEVENHEKGVLTLTRNGVYVTVTIFQNRLNSLDIFSGSELEHISITLNFPFPDRYMLSFVQEAYDHRNQWHVYGSNPGEEIVPL